MQERSQQNCKIRIITIVKWTLIFQGYHQIVWKKYVNYRNLMYGVDKNQVISCCRLENHSK
jgi:hypothetical protein